MVYTAIEIDFPNGEFFFLKGQPELLGEIGHLPFLDCKFCYIAHLPNLLIHHSGYFKAYMNAMHSISKYEYRGIPFGAWLYRIATNETYRNNKGELVEETQWHNIVAWGKNASVIETYLQKGSEVCIAGKLTSRSWEDADGNKRFITEVILQELMMLGKKN